MIVVKPLQKFQNLLLRFLGFGALVLVLVLGGRVFVLLRQLLQELLGIPSGVDVCDSFDVDWLGVCFQMGAM